MHRNNNSSLLYLWLSALVKVGGGDVLFLVVGVGLCVTLSCLHSIL